MQLDAAEAELLKTWIVKKLEDISDADSDVLAEYVLALVKGDEDASVLRNNCISNLSDFLQDSTEPFVDSVITALQTKSYDPARRAPVPAPTTRPSNPQIPSGPRKRAYEDQDDVIPSDGRRDRQRDRPIKQARRGRGGRHDMLQATTTGPNQLDAIQNMNPQDVMSAFLAFQQAMGLPAFQHSHLHQSNDGRRARGRCRDYDNKGFCARGATCPYQHDSEMMNVEYDPLQSSLLPQPSRSGSFDMRGRRGRNAAKGRGRQGPGNSRSDLSMSGPAQDRSTSSLVVEQIPEDKLDEQTIRDFFGQYGDISEVEVQLPKRLAIVSFVDWETANTAYMSPKVIFDNRFVKVFWHKSGARQTNGHVTADMDTAMTVDEPVLDHEEVAKRQEDAQRKHEEARKLRELARQQKADIDLKLKAMAEERSILAERLSKKTDTLPTDQESEQTKSLRAQLAKLEKEAESLGIDTDSALTWPLNHQGRGTYRGRGRFSTRGAYRGAFSSPSRGGAVKRLDNRPRTVSVVFSQGTYSQHDEALKQYMLFSNNLEDATMNQHPDRRDAAIIAFTERYRAENFMKAARSPSGLPNIGTVEVAWTANPIKDDAASTTNGVFTSTKDITMTVPQPANGDLDYDITEDDRWA